MRLDAKIYQWAKLQYGAGQDAKTAAKLIHQTFGYHSIGLEDVKRWFSVFKNQKVEKLSIAKHASKLARLFSKGEDQYLNGMLSQVKLGEVGDSYVAFNTFDGRIAYGLSDTEFVIIDMFHGQYKSLPFEFGMDDWDPLEFIDQTHFLIFDWENSNLRLYKFDFHALIIEQLDSVQVDDRLRDGYLIVDKSDSSKFAVHEWNGRTFCTGQVVGNRIEVREIIQLENNAWSDLNNSKLRSVQRVNSSSCKLYEFDLQSRNLTSLDIETKFSDGKTFDLSGSDKKNCVWSGHHCFIAYQIEDGYCKVAVLDTKTHEWHDTGITIWGNVRKMFIDEEHFLTVISEQLPRTFSFHCFALKKPDSLVNLAWFAYTRTFKNTGKRGKLFDHLPYTCHLRLELPGIGRESYLHEEKAADVENEKK